jgi:hypothetical protein
MEKFYVYEHWRPDLDVCFYVGKGHGNRARDLRKSRNKHHKGVVKKLAAIGMCTEVRLVASGLNEADAYALEVERISFWKSVGVKLANKTGGGEGGFDPSVETRVKLAKAARLTHTGRKHSTIEIANRTIAIREASKKPELREKRRIAIKDRWQDPDHRSKMLAGMKSAAENPAVAARRSAGQIGNKNTLGYKYPPESLVARSAAQINRYALRPVSEETRAKMSAGQKRRFEAAQKNGNKHLCAK